MSSILISHRLPSSALTILRETGAEVLIPDAPPDATQLKMLVQGRTAIVALLTDRITDDVLDAAGPGLKVVANVAVGFDNIDVAAAAARGVVVTNTPGVLTEATAEFTWALIFAVTRRVCEGDRLVRAGKWAGWSPDLLPGMELNGKQLGIVGGGRIGRSVAAKADAFGMKVVFASRSASGNIDGYPVVSLDELLVSSDIVSLHVPLGESTRHLIDKKAFARMRRSAYLINTARGPVVDEAALVWALEERLISGAALDVFEREPQITEGLRALENVVLAPHIGSATRETRQAMAELAARNVAAVLAGEPPISPVAPPKAGGAR